MKKIAAIIAALALVLSAACDNSGPEPEQGAQDSVSEDKKDESAVELEYEEEPMTLTREQQIAADALISTGNNTRIKNAIEKAGNGEEVNIAAIGGSITEGSAASPNTNCYAYRFYELFKTEYASGDGANVKFVNAGMAGTTSGLGRIRYERDVYEVLAGNPDILIIEFAVNDDDDRRYGSGGAAYESMIYDALNLPNAPAVILMFSIFKGNNSVRRDAYLPVGYGYQIQMVSIGSGIQPQISAGAMDEDEFYADTWHPNNFGHELMSDALMHLIKTIDSEEKAEADLELPDEPVLNKGRSYSGMTAVLKGGGLPDGLTLNIGGFTQTDSSLYRVNNKLTFPENWMYTGESGNESFVIELMCKNFLLITKSAGSFGTVEVFVNGELAKTIDGTKEGGWNNAIVTQLFNEAEVDEYIIEIRMAEGSEDKKFSVLGFGYTD